MLGTHLEEEKYIKFKKIKEYVTSIHPDHFMNLYYDSLLNTNKSNLFHIIMFLHSYINKNVSVQVSN